MDASGVLVFFGHLPLFPLLLGAADPPPYSEVAPQGHTAVGRNCPHGKLDDKPNLSTKPFEEIGIPRAERSIVLQFANISGQVTLNMDPLMKGHRLVEQKGHRNLEPKASPPRAYRGQGDQPETAINIDPSVLPFRMCGQQPAHHPGPVGVLRPAFGPFCPSSTLDPLCFHCWAWGLPTNLPPFSPGGCRIQGFWGSDFSVNLPFPLVNRGFFR